MERTRVQVERTRRGLGWRGLGWRGLGYTWRDREVRTSRQPCKRASVQPTRKSKRTQSSAEDTTDGSTQGLTGSTGRKKTTVVDHNTEKDGPNINSTKKSSE